VEIYNKAADTTHLLAFPLLSYTVLHWLEHARNSSSLAEDIFDLSIPFYNKNSPIREFWLTTYWAAKEYGSAPSSFSLLHLAFFFGIVLLTRKLLRKSWKSLLSFRSRVNERDTLGWTGLSYAARNGHVVVVQSLLEHKADVNAKDNRGCTALLQAARNGHEAVVRLLLKHKADVNAKTSGGGTALLWAASNGYEAVVRMLLEHKADVNTNNNGGTSLLWAAGNGHEAIVRILLEHKADANAKISQEETLLLRATERGHRAAVQLLKSKAQNNL